MKPNITELFHRPVSFYLSTRLQFRRRINELELSKLRESTPGIGQERELALRQQALAAEINYLTGILRRYPYWREGHLRLGEDAFSARDYKLAYGSAQAVLVLSPRKAEECRAVHILGRCYLAAGANELAREFLQRAALLSPVSPDIQEDLAAALIALGEKESARKVLESIPAEKISQEGKTALSYLRQAPPSIL